MLTDLYVIDNESRAIHRIGERQHDSLYVTKDRGVFYHNLQNGDGGNQTESWFGGYTILLSDGGSLEDEFGVIDKRFEKEIKEYLKEAENV